MHDDLSSHGMNPYQHQQQRQQPHQHQYPGGGGYSQQQPFSTFMGTPYNQPIHQPPCMAHARSQSKKQNQRGVFMIATIRIMTTMICWTKKYKLRKYISNIFSSYYTNLPKNPPWLLTESETVSTMLSCSHPFCSSFNKGQVMKMMTQLNGGIFLFVKFI